MIFSLEAPQQPIRGDISLSSSKSESNRALIIQALGADCVLNNLSDARDTQTMQRLLEEKGEVWDVLDAGTTMRFCTAYLGVFGKAEIITGTDRMQQRPIKLLVDALISLGAEIEYQKNEGYPPLKVKGISVQKSNQIEIPGNISSQYISALLMIAPRLPLGLKIQLRGHVFSKPYIQMTLALMQHFGIRYDWDENELISISPQGYGSANYTIESDWSGASYWYSMVALQKDSRIVLKGLRENSFQGDQRIAEIMKNLGVSTVYHNKGAELTHSGKVTNDLSLDFRTCPDLAQTVMVTAAVLGTKLKMVGLESLKIKETDRVLAMQNELQKLGASLTEEGNTWTMIPGNIPSSIQPINTYEDHRMAMAFAPVAMRQKVQIEEPDVVKKSYPSFWEHLQMVGMHIETH